MERKKVAALLAAVFLLALCLGLAIFFGIKKGTHAEAYGPQGERTGLAAAEEEKGPQETAGGAEKELRLIDFEILEECLGPRQTEGVKEKISGYVRQRAEYSSVTEILYKDTAVEAYGWVKFYCVLNDGAGTALYCSYDMDQEEFKCTPEKIEEDVLNQERLEDREQFIDAGQATEGKLPKPWDYSEEDGTEVALSGQEALEPVIPEQGLERLRGELLSFLKENQEYRRVVNIKKDSIENSESEVAFQAEFGTPRVDRKVLHAVYDKSTGGYSFTLQEGE